MTTDAGTIRVGLKLETDEFSRGIKRATDEAKSGASGITGAFSGIGGAISKTMGGLATFGLAAQGVDAVKSSVGGLANALGFGLQNEMEQVRASFNAFTKDGAMTEKLLSDIRAEAAATPFGFREMATAGSALYPVFKSSGIAMMDLLKQAEILAASNPLQGLEGASFSLREAMTGDFTSIIERFNLSRSTINKLKEEGKSNFEIISTAMKEMGFDADLVAAKAQTMSGRWSTFMDTIDTLRMKMSEKLFEGAGRGLDALSGFVDKNMAKFEALADLIGNGIGKAIELAFQGVGAAAETIETLSAKFQEIQPIVERVASVISGLFRDGLARDVEQGKQALTGITIVIGQIVDYIQTRWPAIRDTLMQTWADVAPQIERLQADIQKATDFIVNLVVTNWPKISQTASEIMDQVGRAFAGILEEVGPTLESLISMTERVVQEIGERWNRIEPIIRPIWEIIKTVVEEGLNIISNTVQLVMNIIQGDWDEAWENIKQILSSAWTIIQTITTEGTEAVKELLQLAWDVIKDAAQLAWDGIKAAIKAVVDALVNEVTTSFENMKNAIIGKFKDAKTWIDENLPTWPDAIVGLISSLVEKMGDLAGKAVSAFISPFRNIASGLAGPLNAGIAVIDGFIDGVNKVLGVLGVDGIPTIGQINAPAAGGGGGGGALLARGDEIRGPTMAIVGEDAPQYREWVIPENPAYRERAVGLWQRAGKGLGVPGFQAGGEVGGGGGYTFPVPGYQGSVPPHWGSHPGAADIFAPSGTPVVAVTSGTVTNAGYSPVGGNFVTIQGDDGNQYYYAHLVGTPSVTSGQRVRTGAVLGGVGDTGNAAGTGAHLHIGIGPSIISGTGPSGGAGAGFDATSLLNSLLGGGGGESVFSRIGNLLGQGANAVSDLLRAGPEALINSLTSKLGELAGISGLAGDIVRGAAEKIKNAVVDFVKDKLPNIESEGDHTHIPGSDSGLYTATTQGPNVDLGRAMAAAYGWTDTEFEALNRLWTQESGWNTSARNPSGAFGIPQALGHVLSPEFLAGDARAQIAWGLDYIKNRYGSPSRALQHEQTHGWYRSGGEIDSLHMAMLGEEAGYNEWIIPENPAYRGRALELWKRAGTAIGVPGFAEGGSMLSFSWGPKVQTGLSSVTSMATGTNVRVVNVPEFGEYLYQAIKQGEMSAEVYGNAYGAKGFSRSVINLGNGVTLNTTGGSFLTSMMYGVHAADQLFRSVLTWPEENRKLWIDAHNKAAAWLQAGLRENPVWNALAGNTGMGMNENTIDFLRSSLSPEQNAMLTDAIARAGVGNYEAIAMEFQKLLDNQNSSLQADARAKDAELTRLNNYVTSGEKAFDEWVAQQKEVADAQMQAADTISQTIPPLLSGGVLPVTNTEQTVSGMSAGESAADLQLRAAGLQHAAAEINQQANEQEAAGDLEAANANRELAAQLTARAEEIGQMATDVLTNVSAAQAATTEANQELNQASREFYESVGVNADSINEFGVHVNNMGNVVDSFGNQIGAAFADISGVEQQQRRAQWEREHPGETAPFASGGWISRASNLIDMRTGKSWGSIAERGAELVLNQSQVRRLGEALTSPSFLSGSDYQNASQHSQYSANGTIYQITAYGLTADELARNIVAEQRRFMFENALEVTMER